MWLRKNIVSLLLTMILVISIISVENIYQFHSNPPQTVASDDSASAWDILEPLPDPNLTTEPSVIINGSSTDYNYSYATFENQQDNYLNMSWSHSSSSSLDFSSVSPDDNRPRCNDFIYMFQDFEWEYDTHAVGGAIQMEYQVEVKGDFLSDGPKVDTFVWIIDESDYWVSLFRIEFAFAPESTVQHLDEPLVQGLNYLKGRQVFHLAIGFAPRVAYRNYEPWQNLNGTFSLTIRNVNIGLMTGYGNDLDEPNYSIASITGYDSNCKSMAVATDGSIFTVGGIGNFNYSDYKSDFLLSKWSPSGELVWYKQQHFENNSWGNQVFISADNTIFTVGIQHPSRALIVNKWDFSGTELWEKSVQIEGFYFDDSLLDTDGNFYFTGYVHNEGNDDAQILKFDSQLNSVWNRTLPMDIILDMVLGNDDSLYISTSWDRILHVSATNEFLQNITLDRNTIYTITFDHGDIEDAIYVIGASDISSGIRSLDISKYDADLTLLWQTHFSYCWHEIPFAQLFTAGFSVAPNGSIFIYGTLFGYDPIFQLLLEYSSQGTLLQNTTLRYRGGGLYFGVSSDRTYNMGFSNSGILYISGAIFDDMKQNMTLMVFGEYLESYFDYLPMVALAGGLGCSIIVAAVILNRRRKQ